jgi:5-methylcytosine-specific restriction endonuclease McrA
MSNKPTGKSGGIPKALKQQVWNRYNGEVYKTQCYIKWCSNTITVFNFECGHNIPFSKGGSTTLENLRPICGNCNKSMNNNYTIDEWMKLGKLNNKGSKCCFIL